MLKWVANMKLMPALAVVISIEDTNNPQLDELFVLIRQVLTLHPVRNTTTVRNYFITLKYLL